MIKGWPVAYLNHFNLNLLGICFDVFGRTLINISEPSDFTSNKELCFTICQSLTFYLCAGFKCLNGFDFILC
jgi:hypothetical protein